MVTVATSHHLLRLRAAARRWGSMNASVAAVDLILYPLTKMRAKT